MQRKVVPLESMMLAVLLGVVVSPAAVAQIGYDAKTMEWQVARSDVVVRATITKFVRKEPHDRSGQLVYIAVTLNVLETFKGKKRGSIAYLTEAIGEGDRRYEEWRDAKRELIVFLVSNKAYRKGQRSPSFESRCPLRDFELGQEWNLLRLGPPVPAESGIPSFPAGVFDMNLDVAVSPEQMVKATRQAASFKQKKKQAGPYRLRATRRVMQWSGRSGDVNDITMPIDSRLESLARQLIGNPEQILANRGDSKYKREDQKRRQRILAQSLRAAKTDEERRRIYASWRHWSDSENNSLREEGVKALRYFKSKENIGLLRPLLLDGSVRTEVSTGDRKDDKRILFIRKAAYEVLTGWGVKVDKPRLEARGAPKRK